MNDLTRLAAAPIDRLASLFAPELTATLVAKLLAEPRFRTRLLDLAAPRLGVGPEPQTGVARLLGMDADDLTGFTHRVGAVWFGAALARIIDGESRRRLADRLGPETLRLAVDGRDVAPPEAVTPPGVDALAEAVPAAGAGAFAAWCAVQPEGVARRLALLRPAAEPKAIYHARGPAVVDWVLDRT